MNRALSSQQVRESAAELAKSRGPVAHVSNSEEYEYRTKDGVPSHIANFTKGLPHDTKSGLLLNPVDYQLFIRGIDSGEEADFQATPLGPAKDLSGLSEEEMCSLAKWLPDRNSVSVWRADAGKTMGIRTWKYGPKNQTT